MWHALTFSAFSLPSERTACADTGNPRETLKHCLFTVQKEKLRPKKGGAWGESVTPPNSTPSQEHGSVRCLLGRQAAFSLPESQGSCFLGRMGLTWLPEQPLSSGAPTPPLALPSTGSKERKVFCLWAELLLGPLFTWDQQFPNNF